MENNHSSHHGHNQHHQPHNQQHPSPPQPVSMPPQHPAPEMSAAPSMPEPAGANLNMTMQESVEPKESVPVVKVWSVRGVEYAIMSFMLWFIAGALSVILISLVNGESGFSALSSPLALLLISFPPFSFFLLRLKKAELAEPNLKQESTKRRFSQITQVVSFAVVFVAWLTFLSQVFSKIGGSDAELVKVGVSSLILTVVWGGLFVYYWFDEHRNIG